MSKNLELWRFNYDSEQKQNQLIPSVSEITMPGGIRMSQSHHTIGLASISATVIAGVEVTPLILSEN